MNKILVKVSFPLIEEKYEVWIPESKSVADIIMLLLKAVGDMREHGYQTDNMPTLYNKYTGEAYDDGMIVQATDIKNGTELILI